MMTSKQIEYLARAIVNRLEDRGLVEFGDAERGIEIVMQILAEDDRALEAIVQEAKQRLARTVGEREPSNEELDAEVRRLAAERNFTL
ncbi:MAG TPA: hypothetical protein VMT00_06510 [Thermoanaerobaculia bacterium]|nr:hypothetical protein [Thermoanaerobaculia bacterium]